MRASSTVRYIRLDGDAGGRRQARPQTTNSSRGRREVAISVKSVVPVPSHVGFEFSGIAF